MSDTGPAPGPPRAPSWSGPRREGFCDVPDENRTAMIQACRRQLDWETCAYFAGIPWPYLAWLGHQADLYPGGPAEAFFEEVRRAEADGKVLLVEKLYGSDDPRWAAWLLERRYPEQYGRRIDIGEPRERALSELERRQARVQAAIGAGEDVDDGVIDVDGVVVE